MLALWEKSYGQPRQHIKKQRHYFATKVHLVKAMVFPVVMYGCESWIIKKAEYWRNDAFKLCWRRLLSPLDSKEIKSVNLKGNQSWIFIGRTDAEAEAPVILPPDPKSQLIGKDPDAGKGWRQEEKGMTVDKMVGLHHWLDGCEFEQALGVGDGQGSLAFHSPLDRKESDTTEQLNWAVTWSNFLNYQCLFPYLQSKDHILSFVLLVLVLSNKY